MSQYEHDAVNKFLLRSSFDGKKLFDEISSSINLEGGTLSVDDTVLDKQYFNLDKVDLISYWYQIKRDLYKPTVKGFILGEMGLA